MPTTARGHEGKRQAGCKRDDGLGARYLGSGHARATIGVAWGKLGNWREAGLWGVEAIGSGRVNGAWGTRLGMKEPWTVSTTLLPHTLAPNIGPLALDHTRQGHCPIARRVGRAAINSSDAFRPVLLQFNEVAQIRCIITAEDIKYSPRVLLDFAVSLSAQVL